MKTKPRVKKLTKSQKEELTLIAERLKGRDLFPEKTEDARNFLKNAKTTAF